MLNFKGWHVWPTAVWLFWLNFVCVLLKIIGPARPNFAIWIYLVGLYSSPRKNKELSWLFKPMCSSFTTVFASVILHLEPMTNPFEVGIYPLSDDHFKHQKVVITIDNLPFVPRGNQWVIVFLAISFPQLAETFLVRIGIFFWVKPFVWGSKSQSHSYLINPINDITINFYPCFMLA